MNSTAKTAPLNTIFQTRREAGRLLAKKLRSQGIGPGADLLVFSLPRGGVPVGFEIALELDAPLDVFIVRKLGVPGHDEVAMGAIATGGIRVLNADVVKYLGIPPDVIDAVADREERELHRRERCYRADQSVSAIANRNILLVDDGIATGSTMLAAVRATKSAAAAHIVVAAPVASRTAVQKLRRVADDICVLSMPEPFWGVGQWYHDFSQTTDDEVREFLRMAHEREFTGGRKERWDACSAKNSSNGSTPSLYGRGD